MPPEVEEHTRKELKRLERMNEASGEYSMARTYLDTLIALPWSKLDAESIDIQRARGILDADHYGLEKIKKRILEYLAVRKLNPEGRSPILCFVGPPGVGKTSLGQSIARGGRPQVPAHEPRRNTRRGRDSRPSPHLHRCVAGQHHPGDAQGRHAQPGADARRDRQARPRHARDPSSALLEVLDPEQNSTFRDNYLGVPFDLSKVLFIATANQLDTIPGPLRDRMEIIELTGYTEEEKVEIARTLSCAGSWRRTASSRSSLDHDEALHAIARRLHVEAGCRSLEREIGSVLRNVAVRVAEATVTAVRIDVDDVHEILGAPKFENEVAMRVSVPGVATGLAWTPVGGDILFIESNADSWQRQADPHRPARRRHEGKRAGGAQPAQVAGCDDRRGLGALREDGRARAHPGGRRFQRMARARASPSTRRWCR